MFVYLVTAFVENKTIILWFAPLSASVMNLKFANNFSPQYAENGVFTH